MLEALNLEEFQKLEMREGKRIQILKLNIMFNNKIQLSKEQLLRFTLEYKL